MDSLRHAYPFCPRCRGAMEFRLEGGITRPFCPSCGFVQYLNPSPAAAVVLRRGEEVCLVRRRFPPREGQWTLPAGFLEYDEDVRAGAVREVLEETGLEVRVTDLRDALTGVLPPDRPVLLVIFDAEVVGGTMQAGDDAVEVGWFRLDALPGPIAFSNHRKVLRDLGAVDFQAEGSS